MNRKQKKIVVIGLVGLLIVAAITANATTVKIDESKIDESKMSSYLNQSGYSTGVRNNNPGNMKLSKWVYQGKVQRSQNKDGTHEQFESIEFGLAAMISHLQKRYFGGGMGVTSCAGKSIPSVKNTIEKILYTWACSDDDNNPTEKYISYVVKKSGFARDEQIDPNSSNDMLMLTWSMALFEWGSKYESSILSKSNFTRYFGMAWAIKEFN
jgi:hypothetical protein